MSDAEKALDFLTDAEREALQEDLGDGDSPFDPSEFHPAGEEAVVEPAAAAAAAEPVVEPVVVEEPAAVIAPTLVAPKPATAEGLVSLATAEAELETKFDEGDLTASEFRKGLAAINDQRAALRWEENKAELASSMNEQARTNAWNKEVQDFMSSTGAAIAKSRPAMIAFDEYVKSVTGDGANAALSDKAQLAKAFKLFSDDMAPFTGKQPAAAVPPTTTRKKEIPPTLARVPASEVETTDGGQFGMLDRLAQSDPDSYEAAISKMSPAEFEAYANSAS